MIVGFGQSSIRQGHFFPPSELPVDTLIWIQLYAVNENATCIVIPAIGQTHFRDPGGIPDPR